MSDAADLIAGDALKASAQRFLAEVRARVDQEQGGLLSIFDSWFSRVLTKLSRPTASGPGRKASTRMRRKFPDRRQICSGT